MAAFWTALAGVAAALSALMAAIYTWLTFRLVRGQGEPKIVVYTHGDSDRQTVIMIRIANIGRDVASDIRFKTSRPVPSRAFGLSEQDAPEAKLMSDGPLIEGIAVLGPGDSRDITWGQMGGLMKAVGREPIDVTYRWRHGRRRLRGASRLEVDSFNTTDDSENPNTISARSREKIAKSLQAILKELEGPRRQREGRLDNYDRVSE